MKEAYEKKMQAKLDEWNAEIEKLKAKANSAEADVHLKYEKQIKELKAMQEAAYKKLEELKKANEDAWEDLKAGIESTWDTIDTSVKSAFSRFFK
jgi:predicted nuclease with TOPRIM domain